MSKRPILVTKRFRVTVDVEVDIHELPKTIEETHFGGEVQYGKGMEDFLTMEQLLVQALLGNPDLLRRFLADISVFAVENSSSSELLELTFGKETDPTDYLLELSDQVPEDLQEFLNSPAFSFYNCNALYGAIESGVVAATVEEIELSQQTENIEGECV